jgi:AcrR family transcriptional regulator
MATATRVASSSAGRTSSVTADEVLLAAGRIVERHGVDALTMRRLSEDLGVAVTSIYWHVGNRDAVLDGLVDRLLARLDTLTAQGGDPASRIASLARQLRVTLLERQHLVGLAHERDRTPAMFLPVQLAMATELASAGLTGSGAALALRSLQVHVISSVLMERAGARSASHGTLDADLLAAASRPAAHIPGPTWPGRWGQALGSATCLR